MSTSEKPLFAYLDAEYNICNWTGKYGLDVIEVGIVICPERMSHEVIDQYHVYIRPTKHTVFPYITKLTGIVQADVENGKTFAEAMEEIYQFLRKYRVQKVYVYGGSDKQAFLMNCKEYQLGEHGAIVCRKFKDVLPTYHDILRLGRYGDIALENLAYICRYEGTSFHHALDDALTLCHVDADIISNRYVKERLAEYLRYCEQRDCYGHLKEFYRKAGRLGLDVESCLEAIRQNEKYAKFPEWREIQRKRPMQAYGENNEDEGLLL